MSAPLKHNFRTLLCPDQAYQQFNREERHYAALLFHLLIQPEALSAFLKLVRAPAFAKSFDPILFFEYAHLRDRWSAASAGSASVERNKRLRESVLSMLTDSASRCQLLSDKSVREFNEFFCAPLNVSSKTIQMPSRWSPASHFKAWQKAFGQGFAERACKIAWAFNAKPDLVIQTAADALVCVELKVASKLSQYAVKCGSGVGSYSASQLEIQRFALEDLLGYQVHHVYVRPGPTDPSSASKNAGVIEINWSDVISELLAAQGCRAPADPPWVTEALKCPILNGGTFTYSDDRATGTGAQPCAQSL